nr:retrovirus-related Pol polyprotein from transposon TNT 1-94 [Tanacetum cinerariifolium]
MVAGTGAIQLARILDHLKKDCPKRNKKKSTGFVKKNVRHGSGMHFKGYDNGDLLMVVSEERFLEWIMDSGGSYHMKPRKDFLFDFKEFSGDTVLLSDNGVCSVMRIGKVRVQMKDGLSFVLDNVHYILELNINDIFGHSGSRGLYREVTKWKSKGDQGFFDDFVRNYEGKVFTDSVWFTKFVLAKATATTTHLINRSPSTTLEKKTPMDLWSEHSTNYKMLRILGCIAYSHVNQGKLKHRAIKYIFLGYPDDSGKEVEFEVDLQDTHEPITFQKAINSSKKDEWVRAMEEEMSSLKKNHTWELVDQPPGPKLVSYKWLYKIKEGIEGIHKPRYKARLVARGFTQRAWIDYNEVFSSVVRHTSIRVILSLTAYEDYKLEQLDVKLACLQGSDTKDDMLIACKSKSQIEHTKGLLRKDFHIKELGPARKIFGMEIIGDMGSQTLKVSQSRYVQKILNNYRVDNDRDQGKHVDVDAFVDAYYAKDPNKEAHYMVLTEAVKESIWLKGLLIVLEIVESKEIEVEKIGTEDNAANAFTKVVPGLKFKYCMKILLRFNKLGKIMACSSHIS